MKRLIAWLRALEDRQWRSYELAVALNERLTRMELATDDGYVIPASWERAVRSRYHLDAIEQHPVEDPLDDPNHQVPDEGLPDPISGNDDEDDEGEDDGIA